ncbi:heme-copper oxidase subunit III [Brachybacterium huguangmaarense]|uniref:cytochrome-c oxidase n=1 Tax=Brachybacterium huguangmaarense TaxID=1652028 RepID=A0ABY6FZX8_9MICO|nr:heme-copper oxidase subunit III [Brachybacterium huguangmaarense]UYG16507.1 heme-copper oxidase subunit III [Brachybacterium huguangmaarense]
MSDVTTATLPPRAAHAPTIGRPNATQIGTIVWLASELMFFAGLFAMYFTLHSMVPEVFYEGHEHFKLGYAMTNTAILVASSFTCQFGVFAAEEGRRSRTGSLLNLRRWGLVEWYTLTFVMGAIFVSGQALEYTELVENGVTLSSTPFGSIFYLATGFHGLHVIGGLIAFLFVLARSFTATNFGHHEAVSAICVSYYWHFVDVVWVGLFFVVYLMDPVFNGIGFNWSFF